MAQFDGCRNPTPDTQKAILSLLRAQSDLLGSIASFAVVVLVRASALTEPAKYFNLYVDIEGTQVIMLIKLIAGLPGRGLGKRIARL